MAPGVLTWTRCVPLLIYATVKECVAVIRQRVCVLHFISELVLIVELEVQVSCGRALLGQTDRGNAVVTAAA